MKYVKTFYCSLITSSALQLARISALRYPISCGLPANIGNEAGRTGTYYINKQRPNYLCSGDLCSTDKLTLLRHHLLTLRWRSITSIAELVSILRLTHDPTSHVLDPRIIGEEHYNVARSVQEVLQQYKAIQDIIAILGMDDCQKKSSWL